MNISPLFIGGLLFIQEEITKLIDLIDQELPPIFYFYSHFNNPKNCLKKKEKKKHMVLSQLSRDMTDKERTIRQHRQFDVQMYRYPSLHGEDKNYHI